MLSSHLKLAIRVLRRRKFFTFISLFGIGFPLLVVLVAFALYDHVFAARAPEVRADRTLLVKSLRMRGPQWERNGLAGYGFLDRWIRTLPDVERVAIASSFATAVTYHDGRRIRYYRRRVDGEYWKILAFDFVEGRPFTPDEDAGAARVAVINRATAARLFGDGASALNRAFDVDGASFRVIGVVRDVPMTRFVSYADVWLPISSTPGMAYKSEVVGDHIGIILARSRADFPAIRAETAVRLAKVELKSPFETLSGGADTLFEAMSREILSDPGTTTVSGGGLPSRPATVVDAQAGRLRAIGLLGIVLFLLLPTVNLVNINLSRILERASEIGVRKAFGATASTLVLQFVAENVVLTVMGGALALPGAWAVLRGINASGLIPYADLDLNLRVFGYGVVLVLFFGLLSGAYPAWRMSRMHPVVALSGRAS